MPAKQCVPLLPGRLARLQCGEPTCWILSGPGAWCHRRVRGPAQTDRDDPIADDGTAGGTRGLRKQAEIAAGMILGLTADTESDGICGRYLRSGQTLDLDEMDDVAEALGDTVDAP